MVSCAFPHRRTTGGAPRTQRYALPNANNRRRGRTIAAVSGFLPYVYDMTTRAARAAYRERRAAVPSLLYRAGFAPDWPRAPLPCAAGMRFLFAFASSPCRRASDGGSATPNSVL